MEEIINLENYVLSSNRRKLLNIQNDDEKHAKADKSSSSLLYGSSEHTKYCLLQIENEITSILIQCKDNIISDNYKNTIKSLLNEANVIIDRNIKNKNTSNDLSILEFRHNLRKLFLSHMVQAKAENITDEKEDIYDTLINKLNLQFDHVKPTDVTDNIDDTKYEESSELDNFKLDNEVKLKFEQCEKYGDISKYFTDSALPLLIKQDFKNVSTEVLLDVIQLSTNAVSISNRTDLCALLMQQSIRFDDIYQHSNLTLDQLNALSEHFNILWSNESFLCSYMEKLMPTQLSFYLRKCKSNGALMNEIPSKMAIQCLQIMVEFVLFHDKAKWKDIKKINIIYNYLAFIQKQNSFDLEMFMEYLYIHKRAEYNAEKRQDIFSESNSDVDKIAIDLMTDNFVDTISLFSRATSNLSFETTDNNNLVESYILHYMKDNNWNKAMTNDSNRFKSQWLQQWFSKNKSKSLEDSLKEFIDERYLNILKMKQLLSTEDNNKKTNDYVKEIKHLIATAPIINELNRKTKYCSDNILHDLENMVIFDFNTEKNKELFSINDDEITLHLN
eukprot:132415_1